MGAQLLSENRQNHMRSFTALAEGIQIHCVFMCCSAIYSTMWQTTIQADLRCMHAAGYAVFAVRERIHFFEAAVEKTGCVSE